MNWREFRHNRRAMIGASILVAFIAMALFAPLIVPYRADRHSLYPEPSSERPSLARHDHQRTTTSSPKSSGGPGRVSSWGSSAPR